VVQSRANPEVKGAYQLVEDFMLMANEAVARLFRERGLDTLWRVHDVPKDERLEQFAHMAQAFGLPFEPEEGRDPKRVRAFMQSLDGSGVSEGVRRALHFLLLRALKQAQYDVVNVGHFGLGAPDYLHFTSPIRRYPDLVVHRLLKCVLHSDGLPAGGTPAPPPPRAELLRMAQESSTAERRAMEVEREVVDMYRAFYMRDHVGETYDGTVSAVTSFGVFVQIESPFVEGLIRAEGIGAESYELDEDGIRLVGQRSGHALALGDQVRVEVLSVSVPRRRIELHLVEQLSTVRPVGLAGRKPPAKERTRPPSARGPGLKETRVRLGVHGSRSTDGERPSGRGTRSGRDDRPSDRGSGRSPSGRSPSGRRRRSGR
jgi:ribonuclease R